MDDGLRYREARTRQGHETRDGNAAIVTRVDSLKKDGETRIFLCMVMQWRQRYEKKTSSGKTREGEDEKNPSFETGG